MAATSSEWVAPPDPDFHELIAVAEEKFKRDLPEVVAFDTETEGVNFFDQPFCVTVAWHGPFGMESHYLEIGVDDDVIRRMLKYPTALIGHNIKFDLQKVYLAGLLRKSDTPRIEDTEALAHLDDEHRKKGLKLLAISVLHEEDVIVVETMSGPNKGKKRKVPREKYELDKARRKLKQKTEDGYAVLPRGLIVPYAIKDAELTLRLYDVLRPKVEQYEDLWGLYRQEMQLTEVLIDLEEKGLGVDVEYVNKMVKEFSKKVLDHMLRIEDIVGRPTGKGKEEFNPNSNPQISAFFSERGFSHPSYDKSVLAEIPHPLADALLSLRADQKILDTYFKAIQRGQRDGVFHPSIRQHGTVTGRTSSGKEKGD